MRRIYLGISAIITVLCLMTGCSAVGDKSMSISVIYGITSFLSLLLLGGYFFLIKKKEMGFFVLFSSVLVVNMGYFLLSVSRTVEMALMANRLAYLGSVFLPLSMIMIISKVSGVVCKKWVPYALTAVSVIVFLIAASPGYLDLYYKSVSIEKIGGSTVLNKEYGSFHCVYLFYLLSYFAIMVSMILYAIAKKKLESVSHAALLIVSVFVNICVWLLEQLVKIDFEFLSVSYIITELFLISAYLMIQHQEVLISSLQAKIAAVSEQKQKEINRASPEFLAHCNYIIEQLPRLTPSERAIYECYLAGKSTKEVLKEMNILENTLKFHNKNLYSKLGVSSRKQLIEYARAIKSNETKQEQ